MATRSDDKQAASAGTLQEYAGREALKYQSFDLGDGQKSEGHDRSYLNDVIFSEDLMGKRVLDIGCFLGYFCVESARRGATATGIEPDVECARQATEIAQLQGVEANFICDDFETMDFGDQRFDIVLCLNVLHHMYDAIGAIRKMMSLCDERIVIEFAAPGLRDLVTGRQPPWAVMLNTLPVVMLGSPKRGYDALSRTHLFTEKAMRVLFNAMTNAYEPLEISRSPFKGRLLLHARKRKISHLVMVVGPTSSGKSTLFGKLLEDAAMRARFGLADLEWHGVHGHDIDLPRGQVEGAVVHYDLLRPYRRSIRTFARDPRCDLMAVADKVTVITLMPKASALKKRIQDNELSGFTLKSRKRQKHLLERYEDAGFLRSWYQQWFDFVDSFGDKVAGNHIYVSDGESEAVEPAEGWQEVYQRNTA
jgi:SAM-dependent methyltransferase